MVRYFATKELGEMKSKHHNTASRCLCGGVAAAAAGVAHGVGG